MDCRDLHDRDCPDDNLSEDTIMTFSGHDYWFLIGFVLILAGYIIDRLLNKEYKKYDKDKKP
jgi:hypothetical protein